MGRVESNRAYYAKNQATLIIQSQAKSHADKANKKGKEVLFKVDDLIKVNLKIMRKQFYKASELKKILR